MRLGEHNLGHPGEDCDKEGDFCAPPPQVINMPQLIEDFRTTSESPLQTNQSRLITVGSVALPLQTHHSSLTTPDSLLPHNPPRTAHCPLPRAPLHPHSTRTCKISFGGLSVATYIAYMTDDANAKLYVQ